MNSASCEHSSREGPIIPLQAAVALAGSQQAHQSKLAESLHGGGARLKPGELADRFTYTRAVYKLLGATDKLSINASIDSEQIVARLDFRK